MENLAVNKLPKGADWTYEIKLDGFRVEAIRLKDHAVLYSRHGKLLTSQFPQIARELEKSMPLDTVLDGELVALNEEGRPRFNLLQNYRSGSSPLMYFVFDILIHKGTDVTKLPLSERRALLTSAVKGSEHVQVAAWTGDLEGLERFVRETKLEGIVAKRADSFYVSGGRSGSWVKLRFDRRQEFVIGGYTPSHLGVDALLVGFYRGSELRFAGSVRAGLNPPMRRSVHDQIKGLETGKCPFVNLPDRRLGAWGHGITAEKMKDCVWLKPTMVAEIEFAEWTPDERLRHTAFVGLRSDKRPRDVVRET
jgi:bifunctional non-homologous end joining protein LigD